MDAYKPKRAKLSTTIKDSTKEWLNDASKRQEVAAGNVIDQLIDIMVEINSLEPSDLKVLLACGKQGNDRFQQLLDKGVFNQPYINRTEIPKKESLKQPVGVSLIDAIEEWKLEIKEEEDSKNSKNPEPSNIDDLVQVFKDEMELEEDVEDEEVTLLGDIEPKPYVTEVEEDPCPYDRSAVEGWTVECAEGLEPIDEEGNIHGLYTYPMTPSSYMIEEQSPFPIEKVNQGWYKYGVDKLYAAVEKGQTYKGHQYLDYVCSHDTLWEMLCAIDEGIAAFPAMFQEKHKVEQKKRNQEVIHTREEEALCRPSIDDDLLANDYMHRKDAAGNNLTLYPYERKVYLWLAGDRQTELLNVEKSEAKPVAIGVTDIDPVSNYGRIVRTDRNYEENKKVGRERSKRLEEHPNYQCFDKDYGILDIHENTLEKWMLESEMFEQFLPDKFITFSEHFTEHKQVLLGLERESIVYNADPIRTQKNYLEPPHPVTPSYGCEELHLDVVYQTGFAKTKSGSPFRWVWAKVPFRNFLMQTRYIHGIGEGKDSDVRVNNIIESFDINDDEQRELLDALHYLWAMTCIPALEEQVFAEHEQCIYTSYFRTHPYVRGTDHHLLANSMKRMIEKEDFSFLPEEDKPVYKGAIA